VEHDWAYPMSLDGNIFRADEIRRMILHSARMHCDPAACDAQHTVQPQRATCNIPLRHSAQRARRWRDSSQLASTYAVHSGLLAGSTALTHWVVQRHSAQWRAAPHRQYSKYFPCTTLHTAHQSGHLARLDSPFLGLRKGSTDSFTATHPLWAHRAFTARLARWDEPSCFAARSFSSPNSLELVRPRCGQRCCAATPRPPCRMTCHAE
jgi:hypothetical protein